MLYTAFAPLKVFWGSVYYLFRKVDSLGFFFSFLRLQWGKQRSKEYLKSNAVSS